MPFIMPYTDLSGNSSSEAIWLVVQLNISSVSKEINLTFYAYSSAANYSAGLQSLSGGVKNYVITGDAFTTVASQIPTGDTIFNVLATACESYALSVLDTNVGTVDAPDMVSYFDGATQIKI